MNGDSWITVGKGSTQLQHDNELTTVKKNATNGRPERDGNHRQNYNNDKNKHTTNRGNQGHRGAARNFSRTVKNGSQSQTRRSRGHNKQSNNYNQNHQKNPPRPRSKGGNHPSHSEPQPASFRQSGIGGMGQNSYTDSQLSAAPSNWPPIHSNRYSSVDTNPGTITNPMGGAITMPVNTISEISTIGRTRNYPKPSSASSNVYAQVQREGQGQGYASSQESYPPLQNRTETLQRNKFLYQNQQQQQQQQQQLNQQHHSQHPRYAQNPMIQFQNNPRASYAPSHTQSQSRQDVSVFPPLSNSHWASDSSSKQARPAPSSNPNYHPSRDRNSGIAMDMDIIQSQPHSQFQPQSQSQASQSTGIRKFGGWAQVQPPPSYQSLHHTNLEKTGTINQVKKNTASVIPHGGGRKDTKHYPSSKPNAQKQASFQQKQQRQQTTKKRPAKQRPKQDPHSNFPSAALDHQAAAFSFMHSNNMLPLGTTVKGKQKLGKRKKVLTPLKKQILKERLAKWRESQGQDPPSDGTDASRLDGTTADEGGRVSSAANKVTASEKKETNTSIVFLAGYASRDDLEDEDEFLEIQNDLQLLSSKVGAVSSTYIPRDTTGADEDDTPLLVFVQFEEVQDALAARACWDGMILGGGKISASIIPQRHIDEFVYFSNRNDVSKQLQDVGTLIPSKKFFEIINRSNDDSQKTTESSSGHVSPKENLPTTVTLMNILTEDDIEDEDCLEETLDDVRTLASKYGPLEQKQNGLIVDKERKVIQIHYMNHSDAKNSVSKLDGSILGGATISATLETDTSNSLGCTLYLENILSEDDFDDEECLEATREDIELLASKHGNVVNIGIEMDGENAGRVMIVYSDNSSAAAAVSGFDGMVIGGQTVKSWIENAQEELILLLQNILSEDDFEDDECLEETKNDVLELLKEYGEVESFDISRDGNHKGDISIVFVDRSISKRASIELNGKLLGGCEIKASLLNSGGSKVLSDLETSSSQANPTHEASTNVKTSKPEPMYSGDKVIPEQYAECKRVPKVPNSGESREYAKRIDDDSVVPLLFEMLGELMRLQIRAKDNKNAKARRRLVMGLREVCRGIRAKKVKMVVMANNLDKYGALDVKLQEILDLAKDHELPVIFELNKRKIGKALGKTIKVSVVGIENADGAYEPFKKLKRLYA